MSEQWTDERAWQWADAVAKAKKDDSLSDLRGDIELPTIISYRVTLAVDARLRALESALRLARERIAVWNHHEASDRPLVEDDESASTSLINEDYALSVIDAELGVRS